MYQRLTVAEQPKFDMPPAKRPHGRHRGRRSSVGDGVRDGRRSAVAIRVHWTGQRRWLQDNRLARFARHGMEFDVPKGGVARSKFMAAGRGNGSPVPGGAGTNGFAHAGDAGHKASRMEGRRQGPFHRPTAYMALLSEERNPSERESCRASAPERPPGPARLFRRPHRRLEPGREGMVPRHVDLEQERPAWLSLRMFDAAPRRANVRSEIRRPAAARRGGATHVRRRNRRRRAVSDARAIGGCNARGEGVYERRRPLAAGYGDKRGMK